MEFLWKKDGRRFLSGWNIWKAGDMKYGAMALQKQVEVNPEEGLLNVKENLEPLDVWMVKIKKI